ncbi:GH92 family glycosyl hydrolase [Flammeovirga kamogawensis]|uniref:GH92 family glycosyl hydrolase n=1 Tax=Flammeovirga kamogawensis TaxID=373891 RepID=A0ABX8H226_9BACT|nr:GH92 family glycosyl hydrolase [Flammeovirga kamogawensis]MBB6460142.1 putative alpha-1,2-mannosidase [Flammeovirga kamogawensis]QWG09955.1 GH92 family glycosyl hydrolase [Flammeovirga kamogawensis]TRX65462.1 glycoside hydrolase family 92 protein [Flammeovirga kamogawensis]
MKRNSLLLLQLILIISLFTSCKSDDKPIIKEKPINNVDPFIGTGGIVHTFPGATIPFSMIQLSPDTDTKGWNWCSGYHYSDSTLKGFSHTHLSGTGWSDLGDILVMPTVGELQVTAGEKDKPDTGWRSRFSHETEKAEAGFYKVYLEDYNVTAELTAGKRVGFHKYVFPETEKANIIFDPTNIIFGKVLETKIETTSATEISGYCLSEGWGGKRYVYFSAEFSKPYDSFKITKAGNFSKHLKVIDKDVKGFATFRTRAGESIEVKVGISAVSANSALMNLRSEKDNSFALAQLNAQNEWNGILSKFKVEGGTKEQRRIFYTGVYHNFIAPNLSMDIDGKYVALGRQFKAEGFTNYSSFSTWDTFRATKPLISFLTPQYSQDFSKSLIARHKDAGEHLPLWELCGVDNTCMIGYPSVPVIYDAIQKGADINKKEAFAAMDDIAHFNKVSSSDGDGGLDEYIKLGYVPAHIPKNISKTLEYAYEDWVIAQLAKEIGDIKKYDYYMKRANNFRNIYNPERKMFWPKKANGEWFADIVMDQWEPLQDHWISGNKWAYDYFVPHAVSDLIELKGGKEAFAAELDHLFRVELDMKGEEHADISGFVGSYAHGDEPGHANPYLYNYVGEAWKTQAMVRKLMAEMYSDKPDGMINNEDCGQMSAWYIFSAMGFYPVCPGDKKYIIGSPIFDRVSMDLGNGRTFIVVAKNNSNKNKYVQSLSLNGKEITKSYITQDQISEGGILTFEMGPKPNKAFGAKEGDLPVSTLQ